MSEVCRVRAPSGALPPLAGDEDGRVVLFSGPRATATATIANGGTTSGAVDLTTTAPM